MKKMSALIKVMLVFVFTVMSFSGAALTAQAASPHYHDGSRWEDRDDHYRDRHDHHDYRRDRDRDHDRYERERHDRDRWEKDHKSKAQKEADSAKKRANIAIGVAAIATIVALTK